MPMFGVGGVCVRVVGSSNELVLGVGGVTSKVDSKEKSNNYLTWPFVGFTETYASRLKNHFPPIFFFPANHVSIYFFTFFCFFLKEEGGEEKFCLLLRIHFL